MCFENQTCINMAADYYFSDSPEYQKDLHVYVKQFFCFFISLNNCLYGFNQNAKICLCAQELCQRLLAYEDFIYVLYIDFNVDAVIQILLPVFLLRNILIYFVCRFFLLSCYFAQSCCPFRLLRGHGVDQQVEHRLEIQRREVQTPFRAQEHFVRVFPSQNVVQTCCRYAQPTCGYAHIRMITYAR